MQGVRKTLSLALVAQHINDHITSHEQTGLGLKQHITVTNKQQMGVELQTFLTGL